MWMAATSDYYLANPLSSCEAVVAQWRAQLWSGDVKQYPTDCYSGFAHEQFDTIQDTCRHTNAIALAHPGNLSVCERVVVLASALQRLENGVGVFVAWGPWKVLLQHDLDLDFFQKAVPGIELVFREDSSEIDFEYVKYAKSVEISINFSPLLLWPLEELARVEKTGDLLALWQSLRPSRSSRLEGVTNARSRRRMRQVMCHNDCTLADVWERVVEESIATRFDAGNGSVVSWCDMVMYHWAKAQRGLLL